MTTVRGGTPPRRPTSRLSQARGYHPRGRTAADAAEPPRAPVGPATDASSAPRRERSVRVVSTTPDPGGARAGRTGGPDRTGSRTVGRTAIRVTGRRPGGRAAVAPWVRWRRIAAARPVAPPAEPTRRLWRGTVLLVAVFVAVALRLVWFQFADASELAQRGLDTRMERIDLPAPRGDILDRNGKVLAGSAEARYVFADPSRVNDPVGVADALSPLLGVPRSELLPKLRPHLNENGVPSQFDYLARGVSVEVGEQVKELIAAKDLKGIGVRRDETRTVPGHDLAANLIGFTNRELDGLAGLEASYNDLLAGADGSRRYEVGQGEVNLDVEIPGGFREEIPARPGRSLRLTIDSDLQYSVQTILADAMARARAYLGAAVVLDVRTGEVLAQASWPGYDAANPFASAESTWADLASGMVVDPGSVHKAIVLAACLEEGVVTASDTVAVPAKITKGTTTFTDTHWHPPMANFTLPGILAWSSNVGTILLADQLGAQKLYEYQRAFGLGELTGEGLPGESAGLVQPPENWSADAHGSIPIGLGVAVTPLQMAAVYAAIANGGVYVRPHLVQATIEPDGSVTPAPAPATRRVISAENATALRSMLEAVVVAPDATGRTAAIKDYRVAGKTGTGYVVKDGRYASGEVGSFVGMAPADAPRYVVAVFAYTPGGNGGVVAGPAFAAMMEQTLLHYRVAPTGTPVPSFTIYS